MNFKVWTIVVLMLSVSMYASEKKTASPELKKSKKLFIAVNEFKGVGLEDNTVKILTERIRTELFKTNMFNVVERGQMSQILEEQEFQNTDCVSDACVVQAGQLLGVSHMVTGTVSKLDKITSINIKLISVETGAIVQTDNIDCKKCDNEQLLTESTKNIAMKLANTLGVDGKGGKKSFWKTPWPYVGGGVLAAGVAGYIIFSSDPSAEEKNVGKIPLN